MTYNKYDIASTAFALTTLIITICMLYVMPAKATLSDGFYTPIIAFEFAQNSNDLLFLSGDGGASNRQGMYSGLQWDMAFPFAYAGFLFVLLLAYNTRKPNIAWLGMLFSLLAIPADIHENLVLLSILDALAQQSTTLNLLADLHLATWLKWGAMGTAFAAYAALEAKNNKKVSAVISVLASLSVLVCFLSQSKPIYTEVMMLCFTLFYAFHIPRCFYQFYNSK